MCRTESSFSFGSSDSRLFSSATRSLGRPMPSSSMRISTLPESVRYALTRTDVSGGDCFAALSSSSASSRLRSSAAMPTTPSVSTRPIETREYPSMDDMAARITSTSEADSDSVSLASRPASTRRFSALRRRRAARWSSL